MQSQSVVVSLAGPQHLVSTGQWPLLRTGFTAQLPLRNLHWKPASRLSIRTIQALDVNMVQLESVREESVSQIPSSVLERPLLNIYMVTCEVCMS